MKTWRIFQFLKFSNFPMKTIR